MYVVSRAFYSQIKNPQSLSELSQNVGMVDTLSLILEAFEMNRLNKTLPFLNFGVDQNIDSDFC